MIDGDEWCPCSMRVELVSGGLASALWWEVVMREAGCNPTWAQHPSTEPAASPLLSVCIEHFVLWGQ